jgi:flavin reductase (DIM6/NTAB) family NADH-FMN oxidoreductase RutF
MQINPKDISTAQFHGYMLGAIAPRPIAFASTIDSQGNINLSPYSFFNAFGSNPPLLIFSPCRRVRDNTIKHTLENVREIDEVVINIVDYAMVEQMSLASCEYPKGVNEFEKAGFTAAPSVLVKPPFVKEAPAAFECKVKQVIETGQEGGAANLIICEVVLMHIREDILNEQGTIDARKLDAVARMGGDWYCRAHGDALFEVPKPNTHLGIGIDKIPAHIRNSTILTGNNLGRLGNVTSLPDGEAVKNFRNEGAIKSAFEQFGQQPEGLRQRLHLLAQEYLQQGQVQEAWLTLLQEDFA